MNPDARKSKSGPALSYSFKDKNLLRQALTHRSYFGEGRAPAPAKQPAGHNERLEFLGDAVLTLIFSEYLYGTGFDEAGMSRIRALMVRGSEFAKAADRISLGGALLLGKGEMRTGGWTKQSILAGAFEAVIGAVYLDGGYGAARKTVIEIFDEKLKAVIESGQFRDAKTELQELCQKLFGMLPSYRLLKEEGREHEKFFTVGVFLSQKSYGRGKGRTKKEAETLAARQALEKLGGEPKTK
ncbi:MAG: ribonuclease III [Nitrospiraceae bacterium]|nr:ribonuclease III [Nitrospiraceae bacterium]